uniref:Uncharacterized protein n=1 Tax=Cacopsylla melanoneura TaxID=428564 RepID=A0A8D8TGN9_9HEMI
MNTVWESFKVVNRDVKSSRLVTVKFYVEPLPYYSLSLPSPSLLPPLPPFLTIYYFTFSFPLQQFSFPTSPKTLYTYTGCAWHKEDIGCEIQKFGSRGLNWGMEKYQV